MLTDAQKRESILEDLEEEARPVAPAWISISDGDTVRVTKILDALVTEGLVVKTSRRIPSFTQTLYELNETSA